MLLRIWRAAVEATHDFLTPADVDFFADRLLTTYLPAVRLTVAELDGEPVAFSGVADDMLEMLFVHPDRAGTGIGSALLAAARDEIPALRVDVNEQNPAAVGFYLAHGFQAVGRSELDGDGRPFPILHLATA